MITASHDKNDLPFCPKIFVFCGEHSGDLHGSHLVEALKRRIPGLIASGIPGPKMRCAGVQSILNMEDFEVMGFSDVIAALPRLLRFFYQVRDYILAAKPDLLVLIDYPGFNLKLARALRNKGYQGKIVQYISPSVWAWGKHRIETMNKSLNLLLTIYPFESKHFTATSLQVSYVGNPINEYIKKHVYRPLWKEELKLPKTDHLIAIFPGSRKGEIKRHLPLALKAADIYKRKYPDAIFGISSIQQTTLEFLKRRSFAFPNSLFSVPQEYTYELIRDSRTALAKSGTIALELALHRRPAVILYKLTLLNRLYAKYLLKLRLPYYCIANILSGRMIYPELIENGLNAYNIFLSLERLNNDPSERDACIQACSQLSEELGDSTASEVAAEKVLELLRC